MPLGRRNQLRAFEDRLTRVLAPVAGAITAAVLLGEGARRYRGRLAARHPEDTHLLPRAESPAEALEVAGLASQDAVRVAVSGYRSASRAEVALFNMFAGFVGVSLFIRVSTLGVREGWWGGNVRLGGRHIHHFVPGILVAFCSGAGALISDDERIETTLAIPFGIGVGLTFDEAALLLDLRDVYWSREGVLSVQVSLSVATFLGAVILGMRMLQRGETRAAEQGRIPG
ncbi:MAG: hypothetical protein EDQ89_05025 [Acidobacteria bacterium]|nr:MAG: hypothetical protein EDQ89_05025 [Acidobacteriota bacterium]MCL4287046.1 hypothetical protein [Thermoleophilia bacterium]GIK76365.1 MAG: hypothetical protein BroJett022_00550 [Actinomycetes bacterium]